MDSSKSKDERFQVHQRDHTSHAVIDGLKDVYSAKLRPIEDAFSFGDFHYGSGVLSDNEISSKSHILVIGAYSTGKTTLIRHLLQRDHPNINIGPEPTSDKFMVIMHGDEEGPVDGNTLTVDANLPYAGLGQYGSGFLNKLQASVCTSPFLEGITVVDTPGVLSSGEMQKCKRSYNFAEVTRWFADRSDLILFLFDAHKLDISDELNEVMSSLTANAHREKVRIVLNKADQIDKSKLMRVYGALMWSLGKIFSSPEVIRVYVGSFWDEPMKHAEHSKLFVRDHAELIKEITDLPKRSAVKKVNEIISRAKMVKAHVCLLGFLRSQMPRLWGGAEQQARLTEHMAECFSEVAARYGLHDADMPDREAFTQALKGLDFASFPPLRKDVLRTLDDVIKKDIPGVMDDAGGHAKVFKYTPLNVSPIQRRSDTDRQMHWDDQRRGGARGKGGRRGCGCMALLWMALVLVLGGLGALFTTQPELLRPELLSASGLRFREALDSIAAGVVVGRQSAAQTFAGLAEHGTAALKAWRDEAVGRGHEWARRVNGAPSESEAEGGAGTGAEAEGGAGAGKEKAPDGEALAAATAAAAAAAAEAAVADATTGEAHADVLADGEIGGG